MRPSDRDRDSASESDSEPDSGRRPGLRRAVTVAVTGDEFELSIECSGKAECSGSADQSKSPQSKRIHCPTDKPDPGPVIRTRLRVGFHRPVEASVESRVQRAKSLAPAELAWGPGSDWPSWRLCDNRGRPGRHCRPRRASLASFKFYTSGPSSPGLGQSGRPASLSSSRTMVVTIQAMWKWN